MGLREQGVLVAEDESAMPYPPIDEPPTVTRIFPGMAHATISCVAAIPGAAIAGAAIPGTASPGAARIMIVEDEALVALVLEERLADLGHIVCGTAVSAEEAVAMAERERPEVILMDVNLKGARDGIHAASEIAARQRVAVIYQTAFTDAPTRARMLATEPVAIVTKPYSDAALREALRRATAAGHGVAQVAPQVAPRAASGAW
jgi:CheY-like chemotaxis protein